MAWPTHVVDAQTEPGQADRGGQFPSGTVVECRNETSATKSKR